jgi:Ohr subfamily peroxiredoxin
MPQYTAHATTIAGRNGHVESSDGVVKFDLSVPRELGGPGKAGATNPEQLFASGYSACFGGAIAYIAGLQKIHLDEVKVTADVTINASESGFDLSVNLLASLKGVDHAQAEKLVHEAHQVCPYSKATRGNISVTVAAA